MTGDSSGGGGSEGGSGGILGSYISSVLGEFGVGTRGTGKMAARAMQQLTLRLLRFQQIQAAVAKRQWEFGMKASYPESPVYGPLAPVTHYELPTRLTTRQTNIQQKLLLHPDSKRLLAAQARVGRKITRYERRHPEAAVTDLAARKY